MDKQYYVYILTNWNHKVIYVGVTNDLTRRLHEHKNQLCGGFTQKYNVNKLVYYEVTESIETAIVREKQIKAWRREKKNVLVETINPLWHELKT
jgi:putative endonuclease